MKCKSCGAEIPEQSSFCGMCGHDLRGIVDEDFIENQQFTQKIEIPKKTKASHKLMKKYSENINSQKILLSKKTKGLHKSMKKLSEDISSNKIKLSKKIKELHELKKRFSGNIHSSRIQLSKKTNEIHKLMKNIHSNVLISIDGWTWVTEGNYTYVRGSVKNIGSRAINHFEVNVKYVDINKNVLDSDFTNWNRKVEPGEAKEFEIKHHVNKNYQCIDISVNNYK